MFELRYMVAVVACAAAACTAERPGGDKPDAAVQMGDQLEAPAVDPGVPTATPNDTVAVRGSSNGTRVLVEGGPGDPVVKSVLPSGGFCVDAPLQVTGPTMLVAYALKDGAVSLPVPLTVTHDPAAPIPSSPMCSGMEQPVCVAEDTTSANCTDGKDNDCDGYSDACDPGCNGCMDDGFGPNWSPFFVPMVAAGTYALRICPCRDDWFAFAVSAGEIIHVKATFNATNIDLDLRLQTPANAEQNSSTSVATSATTTGIEEISWTATSAGTYYLKIYLYKGMNAPYTLTIY